MRTPVKVRKKAKRADRLFGLWKALLFMPRLLKFYPTNRFVIWSLCLFNTIFPTDWKTELHSSWKHVLFCFFIRLCGSARWTAFHIKWCRLANGAFQLYLNGQHEFPCDHTVSLHARLLGEEKKKSLRALIDSRLDYFHFKNIAFNEDKRCQVFKKIKIEIPRNIVPQKRPDLLRLVVSAETPTDRFHFMS